MELFSDIFVVSMASKLPQFGVLPVNFIHGHQKLHKRMYAELVKTPIINKPRAPRRFDPLPLDSRVSCCTNTRNIDPRGKAFTKDGVEIQTAKANPYPSSDFADLRKKNETVALTKPWMRPRSSPLAVVTSVKATVKPVLVDIDDDKCCNSDIDIDQHFFD